MFCCDVILYTSTALICWLTYYLYENKKIFGEGVKSSSGYYFFFKYIFTSIFLKRWRKKALSTARLDDLPLDDLEEGWDFVSVKATAQDGTSIVFGIRKLCLDEPKAETTLYVKLPNGVTYKLPQHPETFVGAWNPAPRSWVGGGLKIIITEPFIRMRILYSGPLIREHDGVIAHANINMIWSPATIVYPNREETSDKLSAQTIASEPWNKSNWPLLMKKLVGHGWHQWGAIQGRLKMFDSEGNLENSVFLQLRGMRERQWSKEGYRGIGKRTVRIMATARDGTTVFIRGVCGCDDKLQSISGSVRLPNFDSKEIVSTDLDLDDFCVTGGEVPNVYVINVKIKNRNIKLLIRPSSEGLKSLSGLPQVREYDNRYLVADIDGQPATGVLEFEYESSGPSMPISPYRLTASPKLRWATAKEIGDVNYCVDFEELAATCPEYVGGKGASLALLTSVQEKEGYKVPPGFCLTIRVLEKYLEKYPGITDAIREIEAASENYNEKVFRSKCDSVSNLFMKSPLSGDLKADILSHMAVLRKKALAQNLGPELRFAVRSSAVGEDSESLSAAGQNTTCLGCVTDEDVLRSVVECWSSMYAFTSAHYRRENGQSCFCGGGVVVQALVRSRTAGVLFTRLPHNGDSTNMLLTASYGLGEAVVSGTVDPDTFIISRDLRNNLSITKTQLGAKKYRMNAGGSGVVTEDVPVTEQSASCLTEDEILQLARLGSTMDDLWAAARDIEWAITDNGLYLLQARPVTSLESWTEEELLHELDTPIMSDEELLSTANVGEVFPQSVSPLSHDFVVKAMKIGINKLFQNKAYSSMIAISHYRLLILLYNTTYKTVSNEIDISLRMLEMALHGHIVANDVIHDIAKKRFPPNKLIFLQMLFQMIKSIIFSKSYVKKSAKLVDNTDLTKCNDTSDLFNMENILGLCFNHHAMTSMASSGTQNIAMNILVEGDKEFKKEHCNDIGLLLSSVGDIVSADVPVAITELSKKLHASGKHEEFKAVDPKVAVEWLKKHLPDVHKEVVRFLDLFGHRAVMEFDFATKPWVLEPEELMKVLQSIPLTQENKHKSLSTDEIIDALKCPNKQSTKKILRYLLPLCRNMVRNREATKSNLIMLIHKLRLAFIEISKKLVKDWYLPEEDLIFYFRIHELNRYLVERDPALLKIARQRRQYQAKWSELKFPEISEGWVVPENSNEVVKGKGEGAQGTGVCGGRVVARAVVCKNLSQISELQRGDILITLATDIGWSPYFPLISGIVTELGGLISHGAVIAREYGLPCVVGAAHATDIFTTGDILVLDADKGTIQKIDDSQQNDMIESVQ